MSNMKLLLTFPIYNSATSKLYHKRMTADNTRNGERHDRVSNDDQETDWVIVKANEPLAKEDYDLIDEAEARCWCGGSDAERCRQQGHTWPLCNVDQGDFWSKQPNETQYQPQENDREKGNTDSGGHQSADKQSSAGQSKEATKNPASPDASHPPISDNSGPFTKLAILTELLDPTRTAD